MLEQIKLESWGKNRKATQGSHSQVWNKGSNQNK